MKAPSWETLIERAPLAFPGALLIVERRTDGSGVAKLRYDGEGVGYHSDEMECEWSHEGVESEARGAIEAGIVGLSKGWAAMKASAS